MGFVTEEARLDRGRAVPATMLAAQSANFVAVVEAEDRGVKKMKKSWKRDGIRDRKREVLFLA